MVVGYHTGWSSAVAGQSSSGKSQMICMYDTIAKTFVIVQIKNHH